MNLEFENECLELLHLSPELSSVWKDKLQQRPEIQPSYPSLFHLGSSLSRSRLRFIREGLEGTIRGYEQYTFGGFLGPKTSLVPQSTLTIPSSLPSDLQGIPRVHMSQDGLLDVAPGLSRGLLLHLKDSPNDLEIKSEPEVEESAPIRRFMYEKDDQRKPAVLPSSENIDDLLPVEFPLLTPEKSLKASRPRDKSRIYAHEIDVGLELTNFSELVPDLAIKYHFELDNFQKEAIYHLERGDSVFVAAHTSAGKTAVAEYAIALATKHLTRAIYTSPIKALSNQKFRDFKEKFDDVGILTGDVQINQEASCLIMTTEVLRSMLYRSADLIRDVEYVIFDEVHYVNDQERGVVWEEVIIMLPQHVTLILLSATVPNTSEFANWVGRTKKKDIYVISTLKRPVPLEYFLWVNKALVKIVDSNKHFLTEGYREAVNFMKKPKVVKPDSRGKKHQHTSHMGRASPRTQIDRNVFVHLLDYLKRNSLLPVVAFVFSKKRCEEYASTLSNIDLSVHSEKSEIHIAIEKAIVRLNSEDRLLPQIARMRDFLSRGIAVHHGGLLPIVKEIVELLFARGLVKVLFATETFAMGVNMPAKSVVFSSLRKHDGQNFRDLLPGEMTQMAGRAGRRGLDTTGTVVILSGPDELPSSTMLSSIILGKPSKLESQFRLTYNMILNLLRVETLRIEEMIKKSFSENATQSLFPEQQQLITNSENSLALLSVPECEICDQDLTHCYSWIIEAANLRSAGYKKAVNLPFGRRILAPGRFLLVREDSSSIYLAVLLSEFKSMDQTLPSCKGLRFSQSLRVGSLPYLGPLCNLHAQFSLLDKYKPCMFNIDQVESVTDCAIKTKSLEILRGNVESLQKLQDSFNNLWQTDPNFVRREVSWYKSKDLELQELVTCYNKVVSAIEKSHCIHCPKFLLHFAALHQIKTVELQIQELRQTMSDQNLELMPDYQQRLAVLRDLKFINEDMNVLLKGRVACEISSANSLVITELVLENVLVSFEPEEIAALLSAFVFDEKSDIEPSVSSHLETGKLQVLMIAERVQDIELKHKVSSVGESSILDNVPRFGLMEIVYEWARGMNFKKITELCEKSEIYSVSFEGSIVRTITRLHELCREVRNASRIIGDTTLYEKLEKTMSLLKRDIVFAPSLYF